MTMPTRTRAPEGTDTLIVGRTLARLSRLVERGCRDASLSLPQFQLLQLLSHGPARAAELAARASVTRPSITSLIDGLEQQGMLNRKLVPGDRRGISLIVTQPGRSALGRAERSIAERLEDALSGPALESVAAALVRVAEELDQLLEQHLTKETPRGC